jgi:hypothetical protein
MAPRDDWPNPRLRPHGCHPADSAAAAAGLHFRPSEDHPARHQPQQNAPETCRCVNPTTTLLRRRAKPEPIKAVGDASVAALGVEMGAPRYFRSPSWPQQLCSPKAGPPPNESAAKRRP